MTADPAALTDLRATISYLPIHDGDGYCYGGDVILSIGELAVSLGPGSKAGSVARELARRWNKEADALLAAAPAQEEAS